MLAAGDYLAPPFKRWIARLFLRLGSDAEVLEPAGLRDEIASEARETLARYGRASA